MLSFLKFSVFTTAVGQDQFIEQPGDIHNLENETQGRHLIGQDSDSSSDDFQANLKWVEDFENDPETRRLDAADAAFEAAHLDGSIHSGRSLRSGAAVELEGFNRRLAVAVSGSWGGLVTYDAATATTFLKSANSIVPALSMEQKLSYNLHNFRKAASHCWNTCTVQLDEDDYDIPWATYLVKLDGRSGFKIKGATSSKGYAASNINIHRYDRVTGNQPQMFVFWILNSQDTVVKNIRIRHHVDYPNHLVGHVDAVSGTSVTISVDPRHFKNVPDNFYVEHMMKLQRTKLSYPLNWALGNWERFGSVGVTKLAGNQWRLTGVSGGASSLVNSNVMIMHRKRAVVGVKAELTTRLTLSHVKFGTFAGAAINAQRVKQLVIYNCKAQLIHNMDQVSQKHWWNTVNDFAWVRSPSGTGHRMTKNKVQQATDDYFNWHTFAPKVSEAPTWFWWQWVEYGKYVRFYDGNGDYMGYEQWLGDYPAHMKDYYAVPYYWVTREPREGNDPFVDRRTASLQIVEFIVENSRARGLIKTHNVWMKDITVTHNFMNAIGVGAEMCSKWHEGVSAKGVLAEDITISNVGIGGNPAWGAAITVGTDCNGEYGREAHADIKFDRVTFDKGSVQSEIALRSRYVDNLQLARMGSACANLDVVPSNSCT